MRNLRKILAVILSVMMVMAFVPAFSANAESEGYRGSYLVFSESTPSTVNEEQKWEWVQETLTLKLNGVDLKPDGEQNVCIDFEEPIDPNAVYTVEFYGENKVLKSIEGNYDTNITFKGAEDAVLTVVDEGLSAIYGANIIVESGTINLDTMIWAHRSFVLNGGTVNIDTSWDSADAPRGIMTFSDGEIVFNGGKYNFYGNFNGKNQPVAILVQNESMEDCAVQAIKINGGDIYIKDAYIGIGSLFRSVLIDNAGKGTITFEDVGVGIFLNSGKYASELYIKSADIVSNTVPADKISTDIYTTTVNVTVRIGEADYSRVEAALNSIPNELTGVSLGNTMALIEAKNSVVYGLSCFEQEKVDAMADKLEKIVQKILDEVPEEPEEPEDPADPPSDEPEEPNWFIRLIRAIVNAFKTVFSFLFGWIFK